MTEVVQLEQPTFKIQVEESVAVRLIHVLERIIRDPSVDLDRVERAMAMTREAMVIEAERAFNTDLARLMAVLPTFEERGAIVIGKGGKPQTYALWEDINRELRPLLAEYGLSLTFDIGTSEKTVGGIGILAHAGGHTRRSREFTLPLDLSGSKNQVQSFGSSASYVKRYIASSMLNLTSSAEADDDGRAAGGMEAISEDQLQELQSMVVKTASDIKAFCTYMEVAELKDLRASQFEKAMAALKRKEQLAEKPTEQP